MDEQIDPVEELSLRDLVQETFQEHERTLNEMHEIGILVKQSAAEVERLSQQNTRVGTYLRQLQTNFDTIPREDIKEGYESLINAQQRLFTMRGQLEKLESDYHNLERLVSLQKSLLDATEGMEDLPKYRQRSPDQSGFIRVIQSEEAARQSLVRRMHDGPASSLSNFILQAEICQRFFDTDPGRARVELIALKKSATETFREVKDFIFDLRPMMLDDLGVIPTLRRYVESVADKSDISVSMSVTGIERRLEEHVEVSIFRGVQELLANSRLHGQASSVQILLDMDSERVLVVVEDDGTGFDVEGLTADDKRRSTIGLPTLSERIETLGGELTLQSSAGQGTRAEFWVPALGVEDKHLVT
ncbi:MAG TPA: ATP-binding protein [candidate division Zixibacteria bacterium]|nr:ATP-binding protein [candidate division Zixibacteria bacterium]